MVGEARRENLCLRFQATEGAGMDDAVAVARVFATVSMRGFQKTPAAGRSGLHCPGRSWTRFVDGRDLPKKLQAVLPQDFGAIDPRPRSASSATVVFG